MFLLSCLRPIVAVLAVGASLAFASPGERRLNWGDQGDGTYRNPVLFADFSDPDVIRVGDDFYLIASDFHYVGMQVLHSRDLVNWRIIGQVFDRLSMHPRYDRMYGYAQGTWAPSLRFHQGEFHIYVCTPKDGLFLWRAKNPAGPWSEVVTVKAVSGWEDPCPFWDDDGKAWLVRGQVGAGPLLLHRMTDDGTQLLDDGVEIYRGPVAEGPKLFKRNGWYYISLPEGGVEQGGQTMLRSRTIQGPYERRVVLPDGSPHQGGIIELDNGEAWFMGFKSTGSFGRVCHLQPVRWGADDWPVFGHEGLPVLGGKKPGLPLMTAPIGLQTSDTFDGSSLSPQWQWNHNPVREAFSLVGQPGVLRLKPRPAPDLVAAVNTLTQKLWGPAGTITVKVDGRGLVDSQRAGLVFISGKVFNPISLVQRNRGATVEWDGGRQALPRPVVWLRASYRGDTARFAYSVDGAAFVEVGGPVILKAGQWKGARIGLFAYGEEEGQVDFDDFTYDVHD